MANGRVSKETLAITRRKNTSLMPIIIGCVTSMIIEKRPIYDINGNHMIFFTNQKEPENIKYAYSIMLYLIARHDRICKSYVTKRKVDCG